MFNKECINNYFQDKTLPSVGLLAFRLVVGSALMLHGLGKIQNPMGWMGDALPGVMQGIAAISEFGGGIALMLGLLTPLATLGIMATMLGAVFIGHVSQGDPFVSSTGGGSYELALVYFVSALLVFLNSPGKFSVDYWLARR